MGKLVLRDINLICKIKIQQVELIMAGNFF
jgi:hypothetical protein